MAIQTDHSESSLRVRTILTTRHLSIGVLVVVSLILGALLPFVPQIVQYMFIAAVPALVFLILIVRSPFLGVLGFYLYSFLRPYDFIGALRPLRLTLVIEVLTVLSWVFWIIRYRTGIKWNSFCWFFTGFMTVIGISVIMAVNNFYAYQVFMEVIVYFVMFIVAVNVVDSQERLNKLLWMLLLVHGYFAVKGIYTFTTGQFIVGGQNTSGIVGSSFLSDENDFALAMNVMIPFAYFGMLYLKGKARILSGLLAAGFVLAVVSSFSRGGLVGLVSVIGYCILVSRRKLMGMLIVLSMIGVMVMFAPSTYWREAQTIRNVDEGTADTRIRYWKAAVAMYLDYPVIGVGAGNGGMHMPAYIKGVADPNTQWGRAFHGTLPQILAELGTLGMFCYLAMLYIVLKQLFRIRNRKVGEGGDTQPAYLATSLIGSIVAYVTTSTFLSTAYYPYLWTLYTLAIILVFIAEREIGKSDHPTLASA